MRAIVYTAPRTFTCAQVPMPEPKVGEIRIKVIQSGVCGTDLHLHEGQFMAQFPFIPGHETVGVVDKLGEGVSGFEIGEQVVINPNSACGHCSNCKRSYPLLCKNLSGLGSNLPGGFAEYLCAPKAQVFSATGLDPDVAVLAEPTSCVVHGMDILKPAAGKSVLVFGAGPTGLILAQMIAHSGAHVTIAASSQFKLDLAAKFGIQRSYKLDKKNLENDLPRLMALTDGLGFDIVVESAGAVSVSQVCIQLTRDGGTVLFYGVTDESDRISISPYEIFRRELTIKGSFAEIDSIPGALEVLRSGVVKTSGLITHRFALEDYEKALAAQLHDPTRHKIVMVP
jgi:D-arabinitol dehydrogenase (NADP+)